MKEFKGKVAVITGAASGIGRGIAERCAQEGMQVVLADVEQVALRRAEQELRSAGATALAVLTDVSKAGDVKALAQKTLDTFGAVHLLFNNAGVGAGSAIWESTLADWEWVLGDQVTKHAVVALSEQLYYSLAQRTAKVKTSVLCPGWVNTRIMDAGRNRPVELQNPDSNQPASPALEAVIENMRQAAQAGMSSQKVAEHVFNAIREDRFYILTHPEFKPAIQTRMENILQEHNPT